MISLSRYHCNRNYLYVFASTQIADFEYLHLFLAYLEHNNRHFVRELRFMQEEKEQRHQCRTCGEWSEEYEMIDEYCHYCYIPTTSALDYPVNYQGWTRAGCEGQTDADE